MIYIDEEKSGSKEIKSRSSFFDRYDFLEFEYIAETIMVNNCGV